MNFNREPVALVQGLLVPVALLVILLFKLPETTVGVLNALIMAIGGAVAALGVSVDSFLPLIGGLAKAVIAVMLAFGLHISDQWQATVLGVLSVVVAYITRPQVVAKVDELGERRAAITSGNQSDWRAA
jgi:hypothetical protein